MAKQKSKLPLIVLIAVVAVAAIGFFMYQQQNQQTGNTDVVEIAESQMESQMDSNVSDSQDTMDTDDVSETSSEMSSDNSDTQNDSVTDTAAQIDVESALSERSMGSADAPVIIREHSSFTCGHCGDFHKNVFDQLKTEYIDTGKVRLIFTDFPLNGPALHASMVARCLPQDRYFDFVDLLFKTQDKWAYETNYLTYLRQNAALAGLGNAEFDACLMNDELKQGVTNAMREAQQKYSINSTPTFVFNEDNVHTGSRSFEFYKDVIEKELAEASN